MVLSSPFAYDESVVGYGVSGGFKGSAGAIPGGRRRHRHLRSAVRLERLADSNRTLPLS